MNEGWGRTVDGVKGRRVYDSDLRRERALASRRAVRDAARELLERNGYAATAIVAVARSAGVSPEMIYKSFGTKAALVKEVYDVAVAGDDDPVPVAARPEILQIQQEPDVSTKLRLYAETAAGRAGRTVRLQLIIRNAAGGDPAIHDLWQQIQQERLIGVTGLARHLAAAGGLQAGVDVDRARDILWAFISVEVYDLFVLQRGWTDQAYTDWLTGTLIASLAPRRPARR